MKSRAFGNNFVMVYAVTLVILVFFIVLYALTRVNERESLSIFISKDEYKKKADDFVRSLPLPAKNSAQNGKKYLNGVRFARL